MADVGTKSITKIKELLEKCRIEPVVFAKAFNISPRKLSSKQIELLEAVKNDNHIQMLWSRQTGKSTSMGMAIAYWLLMGSNERIYVFAPTEDQSIEIYDKVSRVLQKYKFFYAYMKYCSSKQILMFNGNFCKFLSASPGAQIRGKTATRVIIDESGDVGDDKYEADILPFLSATQYNKDGTEHQKTIIEAGTPRTKNHFYTTLSKPGVKVIRQQWFDCEFIDKDFVMGRKAKAPQALFEQEYLCKFLEESSTCFPNKWFHARRFDETGKLLNATENRFDCGLTDIELIEDSICFHDFTDVLPHVNEIQELVSKGGTFIIGFDNGRQVDNAALCVWRVDKFPLKMIYNKSFPLGTTQPTIVKEMKKLYTLFQPCEVNIDWTNEKGFQDFLQQEGMPIIRDKKNRYGLIIFDNKTKMEMIEKAKALIQKGLIRLPASEEILYQQFTQQQFEVSGGKYIYYHPTNSHDDQLWSTLLALKNIMFEVKDVEHAGIANIWKKHNEEVGYEPDRYKEFVVVNQNRFKSKEKKDKKHKKFLFF